MPDPLHVGRTEPRLWTRPLRELTPQTSRGFEVIEFAKVFLGIDLYPWQKWLLIHGLEILPDGAYRFRRVIVLIARQNGKTLLMTVLAAWWLLVDSGRYPSRVPPVTFKIVGTAQNLDVASEPWMRVKSWCNPAPDTLEEAELVVPALQRATAKVRAVNGSERIIARNRAHYEIKALKSARGKPAARVIMDELREHENWLGWNAVSQTAKSFWSGQIWGISNAGSAASVVLKAQREACLRLLADWDEYVTAGIMSAEEYANDPTKDVSLGIFEWSAPDDCPLDDVDGILQANPSIGYGGITVADCLSDSRSMPESDYRTEVLCQWVAARIESYIEVRDFSKTVVASAEVAGLIPPGARTVWGVDVSRNRSMTYVAAAVLLEDGRPFVTVRAQRAGMLWLPDYLKDLAEASGYWEVALQSKGAPVAEFPDLLEKRGLTVHRIDGSTIGLAAGRFKDRVRDRQLVTVSQPLVRLAIEGGVTSRYAENDAWSREKSVTDVAPVVAMTVALYALEMIEPPAPVNHTPAAEIVLREERETGTSGLNLATVAF